MKNKNRESKQSKRGSSVPKGLSTRYQRDFDRKDSQHAPEIIRRVVLAIAGTSTATTGASVYSASNSPAVVNTPEFIAIAAQGLYKMFRVVAIRARITAVFAASVDPAVPSLGCLLGAVGSGNSIPPNDVTGMLSSQGFRVSKGQLPYLELAADAGLNPNALLWSSIQGPGLSAIAADNSLGLAWRFYFPVAAAFNGKIVTQEFYEYDVEFRTTG